MDEALSQFSVRVGDLLEVGAYIAAILVAGGIVVRDMARRGYFR